MPFVIGGIFASSDPEGMSKMMTHPLGIAMFALAVFMDGLGLFVIMKIVKVKT
jgi:Flp pilus assembly protein TadB